MAKKHTPFSEESVKAIADYINSPDRKLTETKQYFDSLERLLVDSKIPTALVSSEVLRTLHNGIENVFPSRAEMIGRSTLKQLLGRINAACQTVCKQQAGNGQENTAQEANEINSDMCVQLLRLSPRNLSKFAIRKYASVRLAFYCNLPFMYNILLLNSNL